MQKEKKPIAPNQSKNEKTYDIFSATKYIK